MNADRTSGIKVTLAAFADRHQAEAARHAPRARPRPHRVDQHVARPARSPRHDRARAAPHQGGGTPVKIHDLKPAPGSRRPKRRVGARYRRQGRQDRGPRQQGPGRARHDPRPLRRWPDAAAPPYPEGEGLQQPVPHRVPRRQPVDARRLRRGRRGHARHAACERSRGQAWPGQDPRPGRDHQAADGAGPRLLGGGRPGHRGRGRHRHGAAAPVADRASPGSRERAHEPLATLPSSGFV